MKPVSARQIRPNDKPSFICLLKQLDLNAPPTKLAAHVNFNIKPHLDTFEVGLLFLCLESICNHVSNAMAYTPFPVAIAV
ncbi:MAG: hypothetical protein RM049_05360 [Nostoc sp. DedQUE04]|uniref:hypothetical protein n=1 Tax=Nostoc sp. DedQUE04 TaxID=3075390 RepID=UPI002AD2CBA7|nr:hypothetical protein [Nostoc sp. DedQUE04]MDZ8134718.1 hypothetical protein [Nostoc sp. DedQUE04]